MLYKSTHKMEYYWTITKEGSIDVTTLMTSENIMLSESSQSQRPHIVQFQSNEMSRPRNS